MVDLRATNLKLRQRARNVLRAVAGPSCKASDAELDTLLVACQGSVKLACASLTLDVSPTVAEEQLKQTDGVLARVINGAQQNGLGAYSQEQLVLCVDAGGSNCKALVMSTDGRTGSGSAGPCNVYAPLDSND
jgi:N-acetylmuramic acid 6-phosphate etherase